MADVSILYQFAKEVMKTAIYRNIQISFWADPKVLDEFTPEDKYFYLYLMTNPHTNLVGCYEISLKQISDETGYTKDTVEKLLDRFIKTHEVIRYSRTYKEILILNWYKYNWTKSEKLDKPLMSQCDLVKTTEFRKYLSNLISQRDTIPYPYGMDTTDTVTNNIEPLNNIKEIIDYLNNICNTKYTYNNKTNNSYITARLKEGHTVDEFKAVIDKKFREWGDDPKMVKYLRPETLFCSEHFESYLNQKEVEESNLVDEWLNA